MVPPELLCRQHLLGEHRELHALVGIILRGTSLTGYVNNKLIETAAINDRHAAVAAEMTNRGYNHNSPLHLEPVADIGTVDIDGNLAELKKRCAGCKERIDIWLPDRA
jgi:hypothetical protein